MRFSGLAEFVCGFAPLLFLASGTMHGQVEAPATLTISVENTRSSKGVIGVLVFTSPQGWPEKVDAAIRSKAVPAHPDVTTLVLDNLPSGTYALVVLHDENENMKLDKNFFGIPREGWGMSNNPKGRVFAPSFSRARFMLSEDTHLRIHLNY